MAARRALFVLMLAVSLPVTAVADQTICGRLVQGVECVLFESKGAASFGGVYLLSDTGAFHVGDAVCVTGTAQPVCISICMQGNGCFDVTKIEAAAQPTPTPTPATLPAEAPCSTVPCGGTCGVCPPCTPGTICPLGPCLLGTCEVIGSSCTCVAVTAVPPPTATPSPPTPPVSACIGDCNGDGMVTVDELLRGVNIALSILPFSACPAFDCSSDCHPGPVAITPPIPSVNVACLLRGLNSVLYGCPPVPCRFDQDCEDGNGCSIDRCINGGCVHDCVCD